MLAPHASAMVIVTGNEGQPPGAPTMYPASTASPATTLGGAAVLAGCAACATGQKVGWLGMGGTLQFNNVKAAAAGLKTIKLEFLTGESRSLQVSVNGGPALTVQFGSSGPEGSYDVVGTHVLQVPLNAGNNTILLSNATGYGPDFNAIEVFE
jgi:alpha-glucosidase